MNIVGIITISFFELSLLAGVLFFGLDEQVVVLVHLMEATAYMLSIFVIGQTYLRHLSIRSKSFLKVVPTGLAIMQMLFLFVMGVAMTALPPNTYTDLPEFDPNMSEYEYIELVRSEIAMDTGIDTESLVIALIFLSIPLGWRFWKNGRRLYSTPIDNDGRNGETMEEWIMRFFLPLILFTLILMLSGPTIYQVPERILILLIPKAVNDIAAEIGGGKLKAINRYMLIIMTLGVVAVGAVMLSSGKLSEFTVARLSEFYVMVISVIIAFFTLSLFRKK